MQQSLQRKRDLVVRARMALQQAQQARSQLQVNLAGRHSAQAALEQSLTELAATRETLLMRKGEEEDKAARSEEHTSALQSLMHISYAVFGLTYTNRMHTSTILYNIYIY